MASPATYGHACTVDYARECLGYEDRKTRTLLHLACRFKRTAEDERVVQPWRDPVHEGARSGESPPRRRTKTQWIDKCKKLSNRQLEQAVKKELPPQKSRTLVLVLDEERIETWERTREAMEKLAGKTLTDIEVFDLTCAESLCTHDLTPPLGDPSAPMGGYVAKVIERDGFYASGPVASNRTALTGSHIKSRGRGGSEEPVNLLTLCMVCHTAIERGVLKATGRAPDQITWEGPFGVIEEPLEAASEEVTSGEAQYEDVRDEPTLLVRETAPGYGDRSFDSRESSLGMSRASRESRLAIEWDSMNRHPAPP